jgi:hypothetical protein
MIGQLYRAESFLGNKVFSAGPEFAHISLNPPIILSLSQINLYPANVENMLSF